MHMRHDRLHRETSWPTSGSLSASLYYFIRPREHRRRDREAEGLGGREVDDELELGGPLDGQVGRFGALEDLVRKGGVPPAHVMDVWPIGHETAGTYDELPLVVDRRQPVLCRKLYEACSVRKDECRPKHDEAFSPVFLRLRKHSPQLVRASHLQRLKAHGERAC